MKKVILLYKNGNRIVNKKIRAIITLTFSVCLQNLRTMDNELASKKQSLYAIFENKPTSKKELEHFMAHPLFKKLSPADTQYSLSVDYVGQEDWIIQAYYCLNPKQSWFMYDGTSKNIQQLIEQYKIHLMPQTADIPTYTSKVLNIIKNDQKLRDNVLEVKATVCYPEKLYVECDSPKIIIYIRGRENTQYALNQIYKEFKNEKGCTESLAFNEKVTSLIYFAQGNRDEKEDCLDSPQIFNPFIRPNMVYFNSAALNKQYGTTFNQDDFKITNPAKKQTLLEEKPISDLSQTAQCTIFKKKPKSANDLATMGYKIFADLASSPLHSYHFTGFGEYDNPNCWYYQPKYEINQDPEVGWIDRYSASELPQKLQQYKIHLMPKTKDIPDMLTSLISMTAYYRELKKAIYSIKAIVCCPESTYKKSHCPKIVIYVRGKDNAQYVLDELYEEFKNEKGCTESLKYNEKVTSFIYFAQGDRNEKYEDEKNKDKHSPYEQPNMVYFDHKNLQKIHNIKLTETDYKLINPATKK